MMLGPRSFSYTSRKEKDIEHKGHDPEKRAARGTGSGAGFGWRPVSFRSKEAIAEITADSEPEISQSNNSSSNDSLRKQSKDDVGTMKSAGQLVSPAQDGQARSKPVAVPGKRHNSKRRTTSNGTEKAGSGSARPTVKHDPNAMPASVAALLAMTSIPRKTSYATSSSPNSIPRRYSSQQLMDEWKRDDIGEELSLGTSPNMHVLLTPPNKTSTLSRSSSEETIEGTSPGGSFYLESLPSLTADDRSTASSGNDMSPRATFRTPNRQRQVSVSTSVQQDWEHPLSHKKNNCDPEPEEELQYTPDHTEPVFTGFKSSKQGPDRRQTSFKSSLSSSLSALRSTWRSLSNFASTPYLLPEDHLSRGLFDESKVIHREMRPRPSDQVPSAELRRYLNPSAYRISPHSDFHYHGDRIGHTDYEHVQTTLKMANMPKEGFIIALQDRIVEDIPPQILESSVCTMEQTEAGRAMQQHDQQYRREIRENSEWLRICVLETNMRRAGKLDGIGHAKIWLPAREVTRQAQISENIQSSHRKVPRRWVAIYA